MLPAAAVQPGNAGCRDPVRTPAPGGQGRESVQSRRSLSAAYLLGSCVRRTCAVEAGTQKFWTKSCSCKWRRQPWNCGSRRTARVKKRVQPRGPLHLGAKGVRESTRMGSTYAQGRKTHCQLTNSRVVQKPLTLENYITFDRLNFNSSQKKQVPPLRRF